MVESENILNTVGNYVIKYLEENLSPKLLFHNLTHTLEVVHATKDIGSHYNLSDKQIEVIQIAAWFHDCGYAHAYTGHETESKKIAEDFLKNHSYPKENIKLILNCIEATRYPQNPLGLEAKIVCDADLYHFTKPDYHNFEQALRDEFFAYFKTKYTDSEWAKVNCEMMMAHQYFTDYGKQVLQKFKEINIERMRCKY